jgi:hypothetical protein
MLLKQKESKNDDRKRIASDSRNGRACQRNACVAAQSVLVGDDCLCGLESASIGLHELVPNGLVVGPNRLATVRGPTEIAARLPARMETNREYAIFQGRGVNYESMDGECPTTV